MLDTVTLNEANSSHQWIKQARRQGKLTEEQIAEVEKRLPEFSWDRKSRRPDEWVLVAERLINEHGNITRHWLRDHGYDGLAACMCRHPKLFENVRARLRNVAINPIVVKARNRRVRLYIRPFLLNGSRPFLTPLYDASGNLRHGVALIKGEETTFSKGAYYLRYRKGGVKVAWEFVGYDPVQAITKLRETMLHDQTL
jgi:hypothetical protein